MRSLWLRFPDEVAACPACGSGRIEPLDVMTIPRRHRTSSVLFVCGCADCGILFANPLPTPLPLPWGPLVLPPTALPVVTLPIAGYFGPVPFALFPLRRAWFQALRVDAVTSQARLSNAVGVDGI